jgi:hypothetical protein
LLAPGYYPLVKILLTGLLAAILATAPAAAKTSGAAGGSLELCGPTGCKSTTDAVAVSEFQAFVGPITEPSRAPGFPPAVRPYYKLNATDLRRPALYLPAAGQVGLKFGSDLPDWYGLGSHANAELRRIAKTLGPLPAPRPATVLVNNKKVRDTAIYAHIFDGFPEVRTVAPSKLPWVSVLVKWPRGAPWPDFAFTVRRGTRLMLRPDHAVRISKALASRILADSKRPKG